MRTLLFLALLTGSFGCDALAPFARVSFPAEGTFTFRATSPSNIWAFVSETGHHYDGSSWTDATNSAPPAALLANGDRVFVGDEVTVLSLDGSSRTLALPGGPGEYSAVAFDMTIFLAGPLTLDQPTRFYQSNGDDFEELASTPNGLALFSAFGPDLVMGLNADGYAVYAGSAWTPLPADGFGSGPPTPASGGRAFGVSNGTVGKGGGSTELKEWDGTSWQTRSISFPATGSDAVDVVILQEAIPYDGGLTILGDLASKRGNRAEQVLRLVAYDLDDGSDTATGPRTLSVVDDCTPFCGGFIGAVQRYGAQGAMFDDGLGVLHLGDVR